MSIVKNFMSPANLDSHSYATQCSRIVYCTVPLVTLGYIYSETLCVISLNALGIAGILFFVAMFSEKKICQRWLRDTIINGLWSFIVFCLPAIIYACAPEKNALYLIFDNSRDALIFGFVCWIFVVITDIILNRKAEKKRSQMENK